MEQQKQERIPTGSKITMIASNFGRDLGRIADYVDQLEDGYIKLETAYKQLEENYKTLKASTEDVKSDEVVSEN